MAIDQTAIQRLKNEISDGELTLRTGKFNRRKLSKTELDALSIYVAKKKNKLRDITKNAASKTTRKSTAAKRAKRKPASETGVLKYSKRLGDGKYEYKYVKKRK